LKAVAIFTSPRAGIEPGSDPIDEQQGVIAMPLISRIGWSNGFRTLNS
jgi:hypothetical protein